MSRRTLAFCVVVATSSVAVSAAVPAGAAPAPVTHEDYDAAVFSGSSAIANRYLPLRAGTQMTFEGTVNVDGSPVIHQIVFTVTDLTKLIDGVQTQVIYDVDTTDGVVDEAELAFMAKDDSGNVWNMGEYPEVFEDGQFVGAPSTWIVGVEDALAGVGMRVRPRPGTSDYLQGLIPSIEFEDSASIVGFVPRMCVRAGCFRDVLEIHETNLFAPDEGFQVKYYAPGVGNIRIDFLGGEGQETLELVSLRKLDADGLNKVRSMAVRLDHRAYRFAPEIYGQTPRVHRADDK